MKIAKLFKIGLVILVSAMLLGAAVVGFFFVQIKSDLPDVRDLKNAEMQQPMQIYTADGKLIGEVGEQRRIPVKLNDVPKPMIDAIIATEDARFYEHHGVDPIGIARALWVAVTRTGSQQGASTITQQVARNFYLSPEKTLSRKIKEVILAVEIERNLTKQEILALYVNKIYLGFRSYGVAAAAKTYFGKRLNQLTLSEIAVIAGLPKAPSTMNPLYSLKRAEARRNVVLGRMLETGKITRAEYEKAKAEQLQAKYYVTPLEFRADYVTEMVRQEMVRRYGEEAAYNKGFKVYATVHSSSQQEAQNALRRNLIDFDMRHGYRGAERLWKKGEQPWDEERIIEHLSELPNSEPFQPAAVMNVGTSKADVMLANGDHIQLGYSAVRWAGRKINDTAKGRAPSGLREVLHSGEQIWVRKTANGWLLGQIPDVNSALVSLNSQTGAIEAIVGGFSFEQSRFNRATQSAVQIGSTMKPLVYAAALTKGLTLSTLMDDTPLRIGSWSPKNSPNVYEGKMRLRVALGKSKNVVAVRTLKTVGLEFMSSYLQRFGFKPSSYQLTDALALGTATFTPLEMARAYAVFNNGGYLVEPFIIDRILDSQGRELYRANPKVACTNCDNPVIYPDPAPVEKAQEDNGDANPQDFAVENSTQTNATQTASKNPKVRYAPRIISGEVAFLMRSALMTAIRGEAGWRGTSYRVLEQINRPDIGGKTGTTNDAKVVWYTGFGADLVTSTYVGYDQSNRSLGHGEQGAKTALPAWISYMKVALRNQPIVDQKPPKNIVQLNIDPYSGKLGYGMKEYFVRGTEPTSYGSRSVTRRQAPATTSENLDAPLDEELMIDEESLLNEIDGEPTLDSTPAEDHTPVEHQAAPEPVAEPPRNTTRAAKSTKSEPSQTRMPKVEKPARSERASEPATQNEEEGNLF